MAQPIRISISKFTEAVQASVRAAVAKHPKFKMDIPNAVTISYLIRGIPAPESVLASATLAETQAFAGEIAAGIASAHPEALAGLGGGAPEGVVLSVGRHVILGIPPATQVIQVEK